MKRNTRNSGPCMGCTARAVGCHGTCERYRTWAEENKALREGRQKASQSDREVGLYIRDYRERWRRARNRKEPRR